MEEIYEIYRFFPLKVSDPTLSKYLQHHMNHLQGCTQNELYSSAYSHLHILYMVFIYLQLLRISREKKQEFDFCWIGFPTQEKDFLKNPSSPFTFSKINEKTVFRFFRLVGFDDGTIGDISQLVNKRNGHLHASGEIFFESDIDFSAELVKYSEKMQKVIKTQKLFLEAIYLQILKEFPDDYEVTRDDLENSFGTPYFFSEYELGIFAENRNDNISQFIKNNFQ